MKHPLLRVFPILVLNVIEIGIALPVLPALALAHGGDPVDVGLLYMLQSLGQFLMAPIWGQWSDRFGRKPILLLTFVLAAIGELLTAFAPSLVLLYAARLIVGLCAGNVATASALVSDMTTEETRSRGMAMVGISFGLGFTIGPAIGALVAHLAPDGLGWNAVGLPFVIAAALSLFTAVIAIPILKEPVLTPEERQAKREARKGSLRDVIGRPGFAGTLAMFFSYTLAASILESTYFLYASSQFGLKEEHVGGVFAGLGLLLAAAQGSFGRLSDHLGVPRMIQIGSLTVIVGLLLTPAVGQTGLFIAATALATLGRAWIHPGLLTLASNAAEDRGETGKFLGVLQSSGSLGRIAGPGIGGLTFAYFSPGAPFLVAAAILALTLMWWASQTSFKKD